MEEDIKVKIEDYENLHTIANLSAIVTLSFVLGFKVGKIKSRKLIEKAYSKGVSDGALSFLKMMIKK